MKTKTKTKTHFLVKITKEDIKTPLPLHVMPAEDCPLSRAISRAVGLHFNVSAGYCRATEGEDTDTRYILPEVAETWRVEFDDLTFSEAPSNQNPITFELFLDPEHIFLETEQEN